MGFFLFPEIKKSLLVYIILSIAVIAVSFAFGIGYACFSALICLIFIFVHFYTTYKRSWNSKRLYTIRRAYNNRARRKRNKNNYI